MKTCPKCGAQLPDEATICNVCGAPLDAAQDAQQNFNQQYNPNQGQPQYQQYQQYQQPAGAPAQKGMGIVAYIGWIGFIIAICAGDKNDPYLKFHLNQSLVLNLFSLLGMIPFVGWIWSIVVFIFWLMALVSACQGETKEVPLLGGIHILK